MNRTRCYLAFTLLVSSAACTTDDPLTVEAGVRPLDARVGVDYSFARPSPGGIRAAGYTFAVRYLSYDPGKNLSAGEAQALIGAGVDVVSNWEDGADNALSGFDQGASDAGAAAQQAAADGAPPSSPIYFSVDFDASPDQQAAIDAYMDGAASVIGRARVGAYGGYYVVQRLFDAGKIAFGWQTYAWSGGQWDARAQLRQVQNDVEVAGGDCDVDQAMAADFGQWGAAPTSCGGFSTQGAIEAEYAALGGCNSFLGAPTTNETGTPDGVGRFNHFQNGSIYWTPGTGAHEVHGDIHAKWASLGWERSALGYPLIDESPSFDGVGRYSHFQNGSIYWRPELGAHAVQGAIFAEWQALGWEGSALGYPVTDETAAADGIGRFNHFQNGSIYFTPATGAHEVQGDIHAKWMSLGAEAGSLGYPTSDEYDVPGGRRSDFQHGSLVWDAQTRVVTLVP